MAETLDDRRVPASHRTDAITYAVRDVLAVADETKRGGKEMIYLNIGDPNLFDFDVPKHLIEAVSKAMASRANGYAPSQGLPEALEAIRREAGRKGIRNVYDVFTAYGASEAIELCITALTDPGDNILLPSPGYPLYSALNTKLAVESRSYRLNEDDNWHPDIADMAAKIDKRTRAIVIINPNNPTGALYDKDILLQVLELARKNRLVVFADEIYDKILFDGKQPVTLAALSDDVPIVTFGGLSKCYLAPGWRVGWAIASGPAKSLKDYMAAVQKMARARLSINHPMQYAIAPALDGDHAHLREMIKKLQARRDITCQYLNQIPGISCVKPEGAFYAFPKITVPIPDKQFVENLIRETGVVVVHGSGFGELAGSGHFRIVFLPNEAILQKAYRLLDGFMKGAVGAVKK